MIELFVFPKPKEKKLYNYSPFCGKSEAFLKLAQVEHKVKIFNGNPSKFPKSKLPVIRHDGKIIGDSSLIQAYIEKEYKLDLDSHFSSSQKAQGFAFQKMTEEFLYWIILYERWLMDNNWSKTRNELFASVPGPIRPLIGSLVRSGVKKSAHGHGLSRHSSEEIFAFGDQCLKALSDFIEDKPFLLGDKISSYDTSIWATLSSLLYCDLSPHLHNKAQGYRNFSGYCDRVLERLEK